MNVPRKLAERKTQVVLVVLVVAVAATGVTVFGDVFGGSDAETIADRVPDGVDAVVYVNATVFEDRTTQEAVNRSLPIVDRSPQEVYGSVDAGLAELASGPGVDPRGVDAMMLYARTPGDDPRNLTREGIVENGSYAGAIVKSNWSESALVASLERSGEVQTDTHLDHAVYGTTFQTEVSGEVTAWVGVLDASQGVYVVGTRPAVDDAIAVEAGEMNDFDGGLRDTYEKTDGGLVRVATEVPSDFIAERFGDRVPVDPDNLRLVKQAGGAYYTDGDVLGGRLYIRGENDNEAGKLRQLTRGGVALSKETTDDPLLKTVLGNLSISRSGVYVVVEYETTLAELEAADQREPGNATHITAASDHRDSR